VKHQLSRWRCEVQIVPQADKRGAQRFPLSQDIDQMSEATPQVVSRNEGRRLRSEQVDGFIAFLNGNLVARE
jgi:hypothetical protein